MLVRRRFGSYATLREPAGLSPQVRRKKRVTRARLVTDIARVRTDLGRPEPFLTYRQYVKDGNHTSHPIYERLGSWRVAEALVRAFVAGRSERPEVEKSG